METKDEKNFKSGKDKTGKSNKHVKTGVIMLISGE